MTFAHVVLHASNVGEQVRQYRPQRIREELTHFVLWLLTFVGRAQNQIGKQKPGERSAEESLFCLRHNYVDLVWRKYPNRCPVCFDAEQPGEGEPVPCTCMLMSTRDIEERNVIENEEERREKEERKRRRVTAIREVAKQHEDRKPRSLNDFHTMFEGIYRCNIEREPLPSIAFHLLEEVGEVADALLQIYTYRDVSLNDIALEELDWRLSQLEDEIADVTSWVFALVIKLEQVYEDFREFMKGWYEEPGAAIVPKTDLGTILWRSYGSSDHNAIWCKHCKSLECECRLTFLTDEQSVAAVTKRLRRR